MTNSRVDYCLAGLLFVASAAAWADDEAEDAEAMPDMEFLEYLGSWEASDEEWMLFAGEDQEPAERTDPAPKGKASVERNDER